MSYIHLNKDDPKNEVSIFYEDYGSGQPVVLVHGWPVSHEMWEYQVAAIVNNGYRCIAYDRRGFGKSTKTWGGYEYDTLASDLNGLMDALHLEKVILVGFSMGGGEVVRYIQNYGERRIAKIALISTVVPFLLKTDDNPDGVPKEAFDGFVEKIKEDRPDFLEGFGKHFFGVNLVNKPVSTGILDWMHMLALQASPKGTQDCVTAFGETDFRNDVKAITVPTLIIHGDNDGTVPITASSNHSAKMIPHSEYIVYEGAPHGLFITDKERLNTDLISFFKKN